MANTDRIVFLNADGDEVSNDPRWLAEKTLAEAGVESGPTAREIEQASEIERLKAALAAAEGNTELDNDDATEGDYSNVKGADLTALAKDREINLKNEDGSKKTAADVRAELVAQDQAKA